MTALEPCGRSSVGHCTWEVRYDSANRFDVCCSRGGIDHTGTAFGAANDMTPATSTAGPNVNNPVTGNDFPTGLVHDWATANAMATRAARSIARPIPIWPWRCAVLVSSAVGRLSTRVDRQAQCYNDYTAAREKALASLSTNEKYQAMIHLRDETGTTTTQPDRKKVTETILAMASLKMQYASDARAIEVQLLADNSDVKAAPAKMLAASRTSVTCDINWTARFATRRRLPRRVRCSPRRTWTWKRRPLCLEHSSRRQRCGLLSSLSPRLDQGYYALGTCRECGLRIRRVWRALLNRFLDRNPRASKPPAPTGGFFNALIIRSGQMRHIAPDLGGAFAAALRYHLLAMDPQHVHY